MRKKVRTRVKKTARYENKTSFWEYRINGEQLLIRYGKKESLGTVTQTMAHRVDRLIREKIKKGYKLSKTKPKLKDAFALY